VYLISYIKLLGVPEFPDNLALFLVAPVRQHLDFLAEPRYLLLPPVQEFEVCVMTSCV
jgi:hypothetical protein